MRAVALQRLLGHTNIDVTLNTYTSVLNKYKEQELEKLNDYYMTNDIFNNTNQITSQDFKFLDSETDLIR